MVLGLPEASDEVQGMREKGTLQTPPQGSPSLGNFFENAIRSHFWFCNQKMEMVSKHNF